MSAWDPRSGVLSVFRSLSRHLRPRGIAFSAFAFDGWGVDTSWDFCDELIDGRRVTLAQALTGRKYDILHCVDTVYSPPYDVEKWTARARFRGGVVLMAQVANRELTRRAHATRYVACSEDAAQVLALDADLPIEVVPNGYDEEVFVPRDATATSPPLLTWVGRTYDPQKNIDLFLDAVRRLPEYQAVVVDAAEPTARLREQIAASGTSVQIRIGLTPEQMADIYASTASSGGVLLSTSRYEGMTIALLEAMACGCPVIAPRIPGHGHLRDGHNALTYELDRGTAEIVRCVRVAISNPRTRKALIDGGLEDASNWTSRAMAEGYLGVYQRAHLDARTSTSALARMIDVFARPTWRAAVAVRPIVHRAKAFHRAGRAEE